MKISRWLMAAVMVSGLCLSACARKNTTGVAVEGPKNKYEVKLEKTEKE